MQNNSKRSTKKGRVIGFWLNDTDYNNLMQLTKDEDAGLFVKKHILKCILGKDFEIKYKIKNKIECNINQEFFKTWSPEMAWCLGLIATDGCITSKPKLIHFGSTDREMVDKMCNYMNCSYKITEVKTNQNIYFQLTICSSIMYDDLVNLGITERKSLTIKFRSDYPQEFMPDFIRGCWDGDGGIYFGGKSYRYLKCSFASGSKYFIYDFGKFLDDNLYLSKHTITVQHNTFAICLSGANAVKLCNYLYHSNMGDAYLSRKRSNFINFMNERTKRIQDEILKYRPYDK